MNIFVLDLNPILAAQYHNNKHVVKMVLETSQLLCGVHRFLGSYSPYKLTHKNHPCSIWARTSKENYIWLCNLGKELCKEYTKRYNKIHKCEEIIDWCQNNIPNIPSIGLTQFAMAIPKELIIEDDVVSSYRNYYKKSKIELASWKTTIPPWWNEQ